MIKIANSLREISDAVLKDKEQKAKEYAQCWWEKKTKRLLKVAHRGEKQTIMHINKKYWEAVNELLLRKGFFVIRQYGLFCDRITIKW